MQLTKTAQRAVFCWPFIRLMFLLRGTDMVRHNGGMRKFLALSLFLLGAGGAYADRLDVSRTSEQGEFSAGFGAAFVTGENRRGTHRDDFGAGRIHELALDLSYTFINRASVSFTTDNDYSDAQVGIKWKILRARAFKLDVFADYGFAWTKNAVTHDRLGQNNISTAGRIHGIVGDGFQWAAKATGQYVWADTGNFWNVNLAGELMQYVATDWAIKGAVEYDLVQIARPRTIYKPAVGLGVIYNMSSTASVHPYVKYHLASHGGKNTVGAHDDSWKFAVAFSVAF